MEDLNKRRLSRRMSQELIVVKRELINLQDIKDVEDFTFDKIEMIRGVTPENINEKCLWLCKEYLADAWLEQTLDTINVKRLTGGLTNQMYYCSLTDASKADGVPHEVVIRLYGAKHFKNEEGCNERATDPLIAQMVSDNKIGPKIYGFFEQGEILHYYKHRQFRINEQNDSKLAEELFRKLAQVHAMEVPFKKSPRWLFNYFDHLYEQALRLFPIEQMIHQMNLVTLKKYDLKQELDWLKKTIIDLKCAVTFTHIDFRGANVMVSEEDDNIILCDFEYSGYGYRGFDFGTIMIEWGRTVDELFKIENQLDKFPDDDKIKSLLRPYIEESVRIFGKKYSENKNNSLDQLVREAKLFSLVADMFDILFFLKTRETEEDGFPVHKKVMMLTADIIYSGYWQLKDQFVQDKTFEIISI